MAQQTNSSKKVKGCRKCGRSKKKAAGKGTVLSQFVRGRITGEQYFKATNQAFKA